MSARNCCGFVQPNRRLISLSLQTGGEGVGGLPSHEMTSLEYVPIFQKRVMRRNRPLRYAFRWFLLRPPRLADIVAAAIVGKAMKAHRSVGCGIFGRAGFFAFAIAAAI